MAIRHYHPTDLHLPEPNPLYLRYQQIQAESACAPHSHPWGQLTYCSTGVMEITVAGQRYLSPPQYAVWIPPETLHDGYIRQDRLWGVYPNEKVD